MGRLFLIFGGKTDLLKHISLNFAIDNTGIKFYEFLAFSHALLSEIRITPLVIDLPIDNYIGLLYEIEEENGRQIQLQVRLINTYFKIQILKSKIAPNL